MKSSDRIIIVVTLAVFLVAGGLLLAGFYADNGELIQVNVSPISQIAGTGLKPGILTEQAEQAEEAKEDKAGLNKEIALVIYNGDGSFYEYQFIPREKSSAFDVLKEAVNDLGLGLKTTTYPDMGVFIEQIGAQKNGQEGKYWLYYVNGQTAQVAADRQLVWPGDRVEFKFQRSPF